MAAPSYYPLSDDGVLRVYETLAERTPIPLVLYNIPVFTKVIDRARRWSAGWPRHPAVAGIKDSSRDMELPASRSSTATAGADFSVLTGTDTLLVPSLDARRGRHHRGQRQPGART